MITKSPLRLGAATAVAAAALAAAPTGTATADQPRERRTTTITFEVPDCDGCTLQLQNGRWDDDAPWGVRVWESQEKQVRDDVVRFTVPTHRTEGLSVLVRAPWEGHTGYVTTVAMRYAKKQAGDAVGLREAKHTRNASACWAGTDADSLTFPITVEKVRVDGVQERVPGSIAYATTTQEWIDPMRAAWHGVLGSQDANICGERPA
ncbi:hypothetical protein [Nocardioides sp. SR21]|uniref:hypothetical protein n=1 Tax=Nocardioides sp. SR21 TaxID=2919501 RepID=UPI001FAA930D|nr:hypothetical protein [Nocardioides sp. SR21]